MTSLHPDDQTTQYRLSELERSFREFKTDWRLDVAEMKTTISNTQSTMGAGLSAIQTQLAAMQVRDEQTKALDARVKGLEDRAWLMVLSALGGFAGLALALFQIVIDHGTKP